MSIVYLLLLYLELRCLELQCFTMREITLLLHCSSLLSLILSCCLCLSLCLWCWSHGKRTWCSSRSWGHSTRLHTLCVSLRSLRSTLSLSLLILGKVLSTLLYCLIYAIGISISSLSVLSCYILSGSSSLLTLIGGELLHVRKYIVMELTTQMGNRSLIWDISGHIVSLEILKSGISRSGLLLSDLL